MSAAKKPVVPEAIKRIDRAIEQAEELVNRLREVREALVADSQPKEGA